MDDMNSFCIQIHKLSKHPPIIHERKLIVASNNSFLFQPLCFTVYISCWGDSKKNSLCRCFMILHDYRKNLTESHDVNITIEVCTECSYHKKKWRIVVKLEKGKQKNDLLCFAFCIWWFLKNFRCDLSASHRFDSSCHLSNAKQRLIPVNILNCSCYSTASNIAICTINQV